MSRKLTYHRLVIDREITKKWAGLVGSQPHLGMLGREPWRVWDVVMAVTFKGWSSEVGCAYVCRRS